MELFALNNVIDGLEAPVRMVGKSYGAPRPVRNGPLFVQHEKRVVAIGTLDRQDRPKRAPLFAAYRVNLE
jgi:hypothetical protein